MANYKVFITKNFESELKTLTKKDPSLKFELDKTLRGFQKEKAISIGGEVYKLRLKRSNQGKSRGYRMYIFLIEVEETLIPLTLFAKNQRPDISDKELSGRLRAAKIEFNFS